MKKENSTIESTKITLFKGKRVRRTLHKNEWWFSILDVIGVLTDSPQPKTYWAKMKDRDKEMSQPFPFWEQLKLQADDGKMRETDCADTEGVFRIVQSIPSSKAEPFKRWLAKVGYERVQEIENPELATMRTRMLYKLKGYSEDWIEKRMRGIAIREELTDEWKARGAREQKDYEILKGLRRENLRDHMDDFELIFNMLGERATTEIHRTENSKGVVKLRSDAKAGGDIAGGARNRLEKRLGRSVVTKKNFIKNPEGKRLLK